MSFRTIQILVIAATVPFGLMFLLAPELVTSFYGVEDWNAGTLVTARLYGVALLMVAGATYACINVEDHALQRRIAYANAGASLLGALVSLQSVLSGSTNLLMWTTVLLFGFFAVAWLVFGMSAEHPGAARRPA